MKLYHGATSVCSQKVRLCLAEIGLDFESHPVDLQKGEQFEPAYRALNPEAVVPTLVDRGLVVRESSLIIEYLDREHNHAAFMPKQRGQAVVARLWLLRCVAIHAAVNTLTFATLFRVRFADKSSEDLQKAVARIADPIIRAKRLDLFENGANSLYVEAALRELRKTMLGMQAHLAKGPWLSGEAFGIIDIALLAYVDRLERLGFGQIWADQHPEVAVWLETCRARPSYQPAIGAYVSEQQGTAMREAGARYGGDILAVMAGLDKS